MTQSSRWGWQAESWTALPEWQALRSGWGTAIPWREALFFGLLLVLTTTALRAYALPLYPVLAGALVWIYWPTWPRYAWLLLVPALILLYHAVANPPADLKNLGVSWAIQGSVLVFLLAQARKKSALAKDFWAFFWGVVTLVLLAHEALGIYQYIQHWRADPSKGHDDAFIGFYGRHGNQMHGLSILYALAAYHYAARLLERVSLPRLVLALLMALGHLLCFYGMGFFLFLLGLGIMLMVYKFSWRKVGVTLASFALAFMALKILAPLTYKTNVRNLVYTWYELKKDNVEFGSTSIRKAIAFRRYSLLAQTEPGVRWLGTGPGTFNSRVSFLLNGNYAAGNPIERVLGTNRPVWAHRLMYPLWDTVLVNKYNLIPEPLRFVPEKGVKYRITYNNQYMDGTKNQPFSSVLAWLSEWGLVAGLVLMGLVVTSWMTTWRQGSDALRLYLLAAGPMIGMHLLLDNLFEFTEFLFFAWSLWVARLSARNRE